MQDLETRAFVECHASVENRKIEGYAIVFNSLSQNLGGFREIILPEAVDRTLTEALDVRALVDHDASKVIGRLRAGTLLLRKDRQGLHITVDTPNTTAGRDIVESVSRGDVTGMSFSFRVMPEGDKWQPDGGELIREVRDMTISEVSVVTFPAYTATDVHVAQRSMQVYLDSQKFARLEWLKRVHRTRLAK